MLWVLQLAALVLAPVYWVVRFLLGSVVELTGKLLVVSLLLMVMLVTRVIVPVLRLVLGALLWLPSRITDQLMRVLSGVYPLVLRSSLRRRRQ